MWILSDNKEKETMKINIEFDKEKEVKDMCHSYLRIKEIARSKGISKNEKMDMIFAEIMRR